MSSQNGTSWFGGAVFIVVIAAVIGACDKPTTTSSSPSSYSPARNTFEHRYATERFRQEGYSTSESQQAADAVTKFLQAQEARKR